MNQDVLKCLLRIWAQVEYDYSDATKTIKEETKKALIIYGFQFK